MLRTLPKQRDFVDELRYVAGPAMLDIWLGEAPHLTLVSGAVDKWRSVLRRVELAAPGATQRPAYAADGSNFRARSVPTFDGVNDSLQIVNSATTLSSSTRPGWMAVYRYTSVPVLQTNLACAFANPATDPIPFLYVDALNKQNLLYGSLAAASNAASVGTTVHFAEGYMRASDNKAIIALDGTSVVGSGALAVSSLCKSIYLANDRGGNFAPVAMPLVVQLQDEMPAANRAAFRNACRAYYGF